MAVFHLSTKTISRSSGRSAVAAAAYRTGDHLTNERDGETHDYRKRSGVDHTEIVLPDGGAADRAGLWNAAEVAEKRKDARTAREWVLAIPAELVPKDQMTRDLITGSPDRELVREFAQELARRHGVAVDLAIHAPDQAGDQRNHHAHLLVTTRQVSRDAGGSLVLGEKAAIELSDAKRKGLGLGSGAEEVAAVRALWEQCANRALDRAGRGERITAKSLAAQGIDRAPTMHLGPAATAMERAGRGSDRGGNQERGRAAARMAQAEERERLTAEAGQIGADVERIDRIERPAAVKDAWKQEVATQRTTISGQATRLRGRLEAVHGHQTRRVRQEEARQPTPPSGLLARFQEGKYRQALEAWTKAIVPLRKRLGQLGQRLDWLRGYLPGGRQGDALAERRAEMVKPELATEYRAVIASEQKAFREARERETAEKKQKILEGFQKKIENERSTARKGRGR